MLPYADGATGSQLPHNMVLPLYLKDPRLAKPIKAAEALATLEEASSQASVKVLTQPPSYSAPHLLCCAVRTCIACVCTVGY